MRAPLVQVAEEALAAPVVKLVGDAKRDYELAHGADSGVVLLGITPWGLVRNRDRLKCESVSDFYIVFVKYVSCQKV